MTKRYETQEQALAQVICDKWAKIIGVGFHIDTLGADYDPPLSQEQIDKYDADMGTLFELVADPYEYGLEAMRRLNLI